MRPCLPRSLAAVLVACLVFTACDQRPPDPALPVIDVTWEPIQRFGFDLSTVSIWASSLNDVYAGRPSSEMFGDVGIVGRPHLYHYDGAAWSELDLSIQDQYGDTEIWGAAPDNVYIAVDRLYRFNGAQWMEVLPKARNVAGTSASNVFAAEPFNVFHFDGAEWDTLLAIERGPSRAIRRISAAADGSLWVTATDSLLIWNASWKSIPLPTPYFSGPLVARTANDAFAAQAYYYQDVTDIERWNGTQWQEVASLRGQLNNLWTDGTTIYAVGNGGVAYESDGTAWHELPRATSFNLECVMSPGGGTLVAGGGTGKVVAFEDGAWRTLREGKFDRAAALWAESSHRFLAATNNLIFKRDGDEWSETYTPFNTGVLAMVGRSLDDAFASNWDGHILHYDGTSWSVADSLDAAQYDFWMSPAGLIYSVGGGTAYRFNGVWQKILDGDFQLEALSGDDDGHLIAVGRSDRTPVVKYFDGAWRGMAPPNDRPTDALIAPDGIYITGNEGLYKWDGSHFRRMTPARGPGFWSIFRVNDRIVAFDGEYMAVYDGGLVNIMESEFVGATSQLPDGSIMAVTRGGVSRWRP